MQKPAELDQDEFISKSDYSFRVFKNLGTIHVRSVAESLAEKLTAINSPFLDETIRDLAAKHFNLIRTHFVSKHLVHCKLGTDQLIRDPAATCETEPVLIVKIQDIPK